MRIKGVHEHCTMLKRRNDHAKQEQLQAPDRTY